MEYLVEKIGMSRTIGVESKPVTLLKLKELKVCELKNNKKAIMSYSLGKKINKPIEGQQKKYKLSKEFNNFIELSLHNASIGDLDFAPLKEAKKVKITINSKGRGFAGVIKRYGFAGGPKSHGSRFHRKPGSVGNCEFPGRIRKGQKMPGRYGNVKVVVKNSVVSFDEKNLILVVKGSVPGSNGRLGKVKVEK